MNSTIILKKGEAFLTKAEMKKFSKGDAVRGCDRETKELKRWSIEQEEEAKKELAMYKNSYVEYAGGTSIKEFTLEYCECDEEGEFIAGSDYIDAEEER